MQSDRPPPREERVNLSRRKMTAMLMLAPLAASLPSKADRADPPYSVVDFDWFDRARSRPVPARLYWPGTTAGEGSVPLVVFSHGIGGSRQGYSYLGKRWSSRGVASLHVQHIGSDATLWRGNPLDIIDRLQAAAQEKEAMARAADLRFALDRMLSADGGPRAAAIDSQRLIAAGHSYGANTTLLAVGAQVVRGGETINCQDARYAAAVIISAPPFYGETDLTGVLRRISVPTLHVTSTDDVIGIPGYHSGLSDRLAIFDALSSPNKLLAVFRGGSHSMFTDRAFTGGLTLNTQVKTATQELTLAFFDFVFGGARDGLTRWETSWRGILARNLAHTA
jgi:predicted dienelactone hydrolase